MQRRERPVALTPTLLGSPRNVDGEFADGAGLAPGEDVQGVNACRRNRLERAELLLSLSHISSTFLGPLHFIVSCEPPGA